MFKNNQNLERWVNFFSTSIIGLFQAFALSIMQLIQKLIQFVVFIIVIFNYIENSEYNLRKINTKIL